MDYIRTTENGQLVFEQSTEFLRIPSTLYGFQNTETMVGIAKSGREVYCFQGVLALNEAERKCKCCGKRMNINGHPDITIRHLPIGSSLSCLRFPHNQLRCSKCGALKQQFIGFKAPGHMITESLYQYARDLLAAASYTLKQVAEITGLGKNTVKDIDKKRLQEKYTIDGKLIKPEKQAKFLGIDEFKLHDGYQYATHIIDMETGHILWIAKGKKKQIVYDFIEHVGMDWMEGVEAVACDMNSDFQEAFEERCEWIQPVFDYFHIVKNFNDKVVSEVRKDEQRRLQEEGDEEAAKSLKRSRFILTSNRSTLQAKDKEAEEGRVIHKGSELFKTENITRKGGYEARYDELLQQNKLLFTVDLVKEQLAEAYKMTDETEMMKKIDAILDTCLATGNKHFLWFHNLLYNHYEGIIAHATYNISAGKIEGINQRIKTIRRQGYGYPDDEYFFLKLFDSSRQNYVRNVPSHRICD